METSIHSQFTEAALRSLLFARVSDDHALLEKPPQPCRWPPLAFSLFGGSRRAGRRYVPSMIFRSSSVMP